MRPDDVHEWLKQRPFQAFKLVLTNGTEYEIRHPDLVIVGRSSLILLIPAKGYHHLTFERYTTVALLHINHIDPLPMPEPQVSN